jgi:two-component system chemotaxis response regulator CheB
MPPVFTQILAQRLEAILGIPCAEAQDGELLAANRIYVAPGGRNLRVRREGENFHASLDEQLGRQGLRPCVDYLLSSGAAAFAGEALAVVLTGMGDDGLEGARQLKRARGRVLIQDRESCVVFGMPGAIHAAGLYDLMGDLSSLATWLEHTFKAGRQPAKAAS